MGPEWRWEPHPPTGQGTFPHGVLLGARAPRGGQQPLGAEVKLPAGRGQWWKRVWGTPESKGGAQGQGDREEVPHYHREYSCEFVNIHETSPTGLGEAGLRGRAHLCLAPQANLRIGDSGSGLWIQPGPLSKDRQGADQPERHMSSLPAMNTGSRAQPATEPEDGAGSHEGGVGRPETGPSGARRGRDHVGSTVEEVQRRKCRKFQRAKE